MTSVLARAMSETRIAIALVGPGAVGRALLEQLHAHAPALAAKYGLRLEVCGISNSRSMLLSRGGGALDLGDWPDAMLERGGDASLGVLTEHLRAHPAPHKAVVDCTASSFVPGFYARWLAQGVHVVTPNKRLNSGPLADYAAVRAATRGAPAPGGGRVHYLCEGTVGAGLPIVSTLRTLLDTGDAVERVEGVFSGTLSYIFNELSAAPGRAFSDAVSAARRRGYTEPDARDDLSGADVARKVLTLARECGSTAELADVATESLVPEALRGLGDAAEAARRLPEADAALAARLADADAAGCVLRYVGSFDAESGALRAGLRRFPKTHPFASLSGTENVVAFTTARYANPPLIVRGPGAGPAVTAAGVFGDLVALGRSLGCAY